MKYILPISLAAYAALIGTVAHPADVVHRLKIDYVDVRIDRAEFDPSYGHFKHVVSLSYANAASGNAGRTDLLRFTGDDRDISDVNWAGLTAFNRERRKPDAHGAPYAFDWSFDAIPRLKYTIPTGREVLSVPKVYYLSGSVCGDQIPFDKLAGDRRLRMDYKVKGDNSVSFYLSAAPGAVPFPDKIALRKRNTQFLHPQPVRQASITSIDRSGKPGSIMVRVYADGLTEGFRILKARPGMSEAFPSDGVDLPGAAVTQPNEKWILDYLNTAKLEFYTAKFERRGWLRQKKLGEIVIDPKNPVQVMDMDTHRFTVRTDVPACP